MKIVVPMAGRGTRLRPHTLTTPKPLIPVAGKPIVQRLVEDLAAVCDEPIDEVAFIIGDFGKEVEKQLIAVAESLGAKGSIYYQEEALGTAHAILCAAPALTGKVIVAFADTLFKADFKLDDSQDGIIWVHRVDDPSAFGVVKLADDQTITDFVEKPEHFVSDLAIIGIYYFKDGDYLKKQLQYLIDNNIRDKGEYQLTNALENMKNQGTKFTPGAVVEWLDCGNKDATVYTNQRILEFKKDEQMVASSVQQENATIIEPCFIGENVVIRNSTIGPHVSIGAGCVVTDSTVTNCLIQNETKIINAQLKNSMVGNHVTYSGSSEDVSLGDYSTVISH